MSDVLPNESTIVECRSCGEKMFFVRTAAGKNMPLNAKPVRAIVIDPLGPGERQHKMRWVSTFTSHHATCPQAEKWRREASRE